MRVQEITIRNLQTGVNSGGHFHKSLSRELKYVDLKKEKQILVFANGSSIPNI